AAKFHERDDKEDNERGKKKISGQIAISELNRRSSLERDDHVHHQKQNQAGRQERFRQPESFSRRGVTFRNRSRNPPGANLPNHREIDRQSHEKENGQEQSERDRRNTR